MIPETSFHSFENFLSYSQDGFTSFDHHFCFTSWSSKMEEISGISKAEAIGKNAFELFPFLIETGEDKFFHQTLEGIPGVSKNSRFNIPETGKTGYFDGYYYPDYNDSGKTMGGLLIIRDITEQKREAELRQETETRFKNMADSSPVMLWMSGTDSLCSFFNQTWLDFTGRPLADEWGVGWASGIHPEDFQVCMDIYEENFNLRKPFEMEYRLRRADGEYRWILDRGSPRFGPEGEFMGFIGSCVDITERKQLETDLKKAIRAREDFLSIASHELKTPLSALNLQIGIFQYMMSSTPDGAVNPEKASTVLEVASRQLRNLAQLIETLLDVSRVNSGKLLLERTAFDLSAIVNEVLARLDESAKLAKCPLSLSTSESLIGNWDRGRVDQVVTNILVNCFKYASGTEIHIRIFKEGNEAILEIEDHGPGIAEEQRKHIFEKFYRIQTQTSTGGLGLGLFIVNEIIKAHNGKLEVENGKESGAIFRIKLPLS